MGVVILAVILGLAWPHDSAETLSSVPQYPPALTTPPVEAVAAGELDLGERVWLNCRACHGLDREGIKGMAPPLVNSALVQGDPTNLIRLLLRGVPQREPYLIGMPGFTRLENRELAAVLTMLRRKHAPELPPITAATVAQIRLRTPILDP